MDLSLRDLAERSGVRAPMLSQVERGETSPTLAVAARIAAGLDLTLSQLLRLDEGGHVVVTRAGERRARAGARPPHRGADPAAARPARRRLAAHARARRRHRRPGDPPMHEPGSRETAVVLAGSVALLIDGERHELGEGDSVTFDADLPHHFENQGAEPAEFLAVVAAGLRTELSRWPKTHCSTRSGSAHEVADGLIYIDLHLVHEVTSPQAFDGLRLAGRRVRRPDKTLATADHNVPTDGTPTARLIADELSRVQVETLERNCEEFGIPLYSLGSDRQGIVHVIGPELGVTQPGMTIVCGDSHTSTHGAFGALAFGIGTSEVEHVLATQCLVQKRPKTMRIYYSGELGDGRHRQGPDPGDDRPARHRRHGRPRGRVRGRDDRTALSMENRMTICNMTIEGGGRAGMIAPDETTFAWVEGRRAAPGDFDAAVERWRELPTDEGASFDTEVEVDAASLSPMVTWGTNPGKVSR